MQDSDRQREVEAGSREIALRYLAGEVPSSMLATLRGASAADLGDAVLDRLPKIVHHRCAEAFLHAVYVWVFDLCRSHLIEEHLQLEPNKVSEAIVYELLFRSIAGRRQRPLWAWAPQVIVEVVEKRRMENEYSLDPFRDGQTEAEERQAFFAYVINRLGSLQRRLIRLAWVEWRQPDELERITGMPYEHIQATLEQALDVILMERTGRGLSNPGDPGTPEFWDAMRRKQAGDDEP